MDQTQALQILKAVLDLTVLRGSIYENIEQANRAAVAYQIVSNVVTSTLAAKAAQKEPTDVKE